MRFVFDNGIKLERYALDQPNMYLKSYLTIICQLNAFNVKRENKAMTEPFSVVNELSRECSNDVVVS